MPPKKRKSDTKPEESKEEDKKNKKVKTGISIGDEFPDIPELLTDETTEDKEVKVNLKEILKTNGIVIFFYPRANTGGCTRQACGFNDNLAKFEAAGYKVFGMSADKPKSQANWKKKYNLKYPLLCDPSLEVIKTLGVARGQKGINRSHIVVEKGGKVKEIKKGISPVDSVNGAVKIVDAK